MKKTSENGQPSLLTRELYIVSDDNGYQVNIFLSASYESQCFHVEQEITTKGTEWEIDTQLHIQKEKPHQRNFSTMTSITELPRPFRLASSLYLLFCQHVIGMDEIRNCLCDALEQTVGDSIIMLVGV